MTWLLNWDIETKLKRYQFKYIFPNYKHPDKLSGCHGDLMLRISHTLQTVFQNWHHH